MKLHEHANHFVHETDEDGEFLDQRKEMREKIKPFQRVDYFERRRNARFVALTIHRNVFVLANLRGFSFAIQKSYGARVVDCVSYKTRPFSIDIDSNSAQPTDILRLLLHST